jgi:hypothetical protein
MDNLIRMAALVPAKNDAGRPGQIYLNDCLPQTPLKMQIVQKYCTRARPGNGSIAGGGGTILPGNKQIFLYLWR